MQKQQISMFDGTQPFNIDKPIRLIELFAGYGAQNLSLKYIGANYESWRISEWAIKSIQAYKDMHFHNDHTDYSKGMAISEVKAWLYGRISQDYNTPMSDKKIDGLSEKQARHIYNNMRATRNVGSITQATAADLQIVNTDEYCYILTYSFPCQDLSVAGNGAGMSKGSGTRSGLLWEVERILEECVELPQVLIMENVPQVVNDDFMQWIVKLEELGYKNYWKIINSKDRGIPQNRSRCFMVSIRGDYFFMFPQDRQLTVRLKDYLDKQVDEKYYLSDKNLEMFIEHTKKQQAKGNGFKFEPTEGGGGSKSYTHKVR